MSGALGILSLLGMSTSGGGLGKLGGGGGLGARPNRLSSMLPVSATRLGTIVSRMMFATFCQLGGGGILLMI